MVWGHAYSLLVMRGLNLGGAAREVRTGSMTTIASVVAKICLIVKLLTKETLRIQKDHSLCQQIGPTHGMHVAGNSSIDFYHTQ